MDILQLFCVFLKKNIKYLWYYKWALLLIFVGCTGILCSYAYYADRATTSTAASEYGTKDYTALKELYFPANDFDWIYYAPNSNNVEGFMDLLRVELQISAERFRPYNDSRSMQLDMERDCRGSCFAIDFEQLPDPGNTGYLKYSISSNQMRLGPKKRFVNDVEINKQKDDDEYIRHGFLSLQHVLDRRYMKYQQLDEKYDVLLSCLPNLESNNKDNDRLKYFCVMFSILINVLILSTFVVPFVEEKQNGIKEFLNLVTSMSFLNGLTFFIIRFVYYSVFIAIVLIVAHILDVFGSSIPIFYIIVLILLYVLANMSYAYLISACFHSVFYAKVGGMVLFIIPYLFNIEHSRLTELATYCLSTNTFLEGINVFQTFSNKHRDFTSAELSRQIKDGSFSILSIYAILFTQIIIYALLYNYLVCVFAGHGGLKRSYLFFLDPNTYKRHPSNEYKTSPRGTDAIVIENLNKTFITKKGEIRIAQDLNMTIKNKEITVLLGHNGAGKTTMLKMILGLMPKDKGSITACSDCDVASYRHLIGFCPQHTIFMNYMTCQEHLEFFAQLRGATRKEAIMWAKEKLKQLNLEEKANEYGCKLSGGMKRRLSLGIALAGRTKIVILDEPSSGLDIESRREMWDILLTLRKEKAILITTHYMEEAEVLGDTICILANGELKHTGSPLTLKRQLGNGYRLKLLTKKHLFNNKDTLNLIQKHIPAAAEQSYVAPTLTIRLPYADVDKFSKMLQELEKKMEQLGIETISITDTSMEDVFLNSAGEIDEVDSPDSAGSDDPFVTQYARLIAEYKEPSQFQQWMAIFYKKWTFIYNEWLYTLCMLFIPILCIFGAIILMKNMSVVTNEDVLLLKLDQMRTGSIYIYNPMGKHMQVEELLRQQIELNGIDVKTLQLRNNNIDDELLDLQRENLADFLEQVIGVICINADEKDSGTPTFKIYFAGNRYHSSVILINLVDTTMLKMREVGANIETIYKPLSHYTTSLSSSRLEYFTIILSVGMFFSMFFYVSLPYREHASGFKKLQAMSRLTYWFATFSFDCLQHLVLCIVLYIEGRLFMGNALYGEHQQLLIVLSIFFYGISYLPILYCLANNCKSISTISTYLLFMLIVSSILPLITSSNAQAMTAYATYIFFYSFMPDYNLNHQLRIINENLIAIQRGNKTPQMAEDHFFFYAIVVCFVVMFFFISLSENMYRRQAVYDFFKPMKSLVSKRPADDSPVMKEMPPDCQSEKNKVEKLLNDRDQVSTCDNYPLITCGLRKEFDGKPVVNNLNFAAQNDECFGLLGVNGAGKTTTFEMLATNLTISGGNIKICGIDIRHNELKYRYRFGYCPQNDALNKFMTAEQSLRFMGRLRGCGPSTLKNTVGNWLKMMNLEKYRNVQVRYFSGGTKRKLLAALAMIGGPPLVMLDEPTTGVDPKSRRFLWQCIKNFQRSGRTVILTSHSMDECEELCNRLAIMAHGQFQCLDNICSLKRLSGFTIKIKMNENHETEVNTITEKLRSDFPKLVLREHHAGMLTYFNSTSEQIIWSDVFKKTESYLAECNLVDDYSVNECTLEDIFLKIGKQVKISQPSCSESHTYSNV